MASSSTAQPPPPMTSANIPDGFTLRTMEDGREVLIPSALVPNFDQAYAAYRRKINRRIGSLPKRTEDNYARVEMAGRLFQVPPNPPLTQDELLELHAEALALQQHLGISYKDATHRLYMAEVEKLKLADKAAKAWNTIAKGMSDSLEALGAEFAKEVEIEEPEVSPRLQHQQQLLSLFVDNAERDPDYQPSSV